MKRYAFSDIQRYYDVNVISMSNWIYLVSTADMQRKRRKPFRLKSTRVFRKGVIKVTIKNEKRILIEDI